MSQIRCSGRSWAGWQRGSRTLQSHLGTWVACSGGGWLTFRPPYPEPSTEIGRTTHFFWDILAFVHIWLTFWDYHHSGGGSHQNPSPYTYNLPIPAGGRASRRPPPAGRHFLIGIRVSACASSSSVDSIGDVRCSFHDIILFIPVLANF